MKQEEVLFVEESLLEPAVSFVDCLAGGLFVCGFYTFFIVGIAGERFTESGQLPAFSDANLDNYAVNSQSYCDSTTDAHTKACYPYAYAIPLTHLQLRHVQ